MYKIQIKTRDGWKDVRPSNGEPYTFSSHLEAWAAMEMCYPEQARQDRLDQSIGARVRVVEVS